MKLLVRITGEMMLKSEPVSRRFQKQLLSNLKAALKKEGIEHKLQGQWSRVWLESEDQRVFDLLRRIFGVHGYSIIEFECDANLQTIVREGGEHYKELIAGKTFSVQANRVGDHDFNSLDVNKQLGAVLNSVNAKSMVNLRNPQVTLHVEIRHEKAYFYRDTIRTTGGLPIGSAGRCVSLVSGGFDSTVASWMMQKRGLKLHYLFCNLAGEANEASVLRVMSNLIQNWAYGDYPRIHIVDFQPVVAEILKKVYPPFSQVILKRLFYRVAEKLMKEIEASGIITGEAISQVSSQTLKNLEAISSAISAPVYRPLVSFDKADIMQLARKIGTFADSSQIKEYCQIVPQKPVTACSVERAELEESMLDLSILDKQFAERKIINLWEIQSSELLSSYVFKDQIPEGATVIDCQSEELYQQWHHEASEHWDFYDLLAQYSKLPKDKNYLLYCTFGTQSAVLAEKMQRSGFEAFSLRGGIKNIASSCRSEI